jgi:putative transcriptional regulator
MPLATSIVLVLLALLPGVPQPGRSAPPERAATTGMVEGNVLPAGLPEGPYRLASALVRGKFLVAGRNIIDPFFSESVVLLINYGEKGAMGLIINRPTEMKLSVLFPEVEGLEEADPLFFGGPVDRQRMMLLVRSGSGPEGALRIFDGIYMSASRAVLERMAGSSAPGESFRMYSGYAGWAPGQLEAEIARGDWHVVQADAETVFEKDPSAVWPELITLSSGMEVRMELPALSNSPL